MATDRRAKAGRSSPHRATPTENPQPDERTIRIWLAVGFCLHTLGLILIFSPSHGIISSAPLIDQDWGLHFHHLTSLEAFWRLDNRLWGYNPYFMAGYPSNTIQDLSIKFFEFTALALSAIAFSTIQWFKICAFLAMASVPWLMYFSARNFFIPDKTKHWASLAAALLGTIYWWNSLPREMFFYGMIGFTTASYLSVLGVSLLYRLAAQPFNSPAIYAGWLLFAAAILPLHVQSVVNFLPPMIALLAVRRSLLTGRILLWLGAAGLIAALVNSPWIVTAFLHRGDDMSAAIVAQLPLFAANHPLIFLLDYLGPEGFWTFRPSFVEKGFRVTLLVLGTWGVWKMIQSERRHLGIMLASALAVLFLIAYFGAFLPLLQPWQPLRFKVPLDLFLVIGAVHCAARWFAEPAASRTKAVPILLAIGLIAFVVNLAQTESSGKLQLRSRPVPPLEAIADWVARETPAGARVLFEESGDETGFVYDGVYLSALLPRWTGRQLIGGPINFYNDRHHFAEFHSGRLFQRDVQTWADEELRNYFRLYNIGAVVAFHPASVQRLLSIPGLVTTEKRVGPVHLMKVQQTLSWFIEGEGKVRAGFNRLELSDITGKEVVLKYHWVAGLRSEPVVAIVPVKIADDPIPFIKLINPPPNLTLRVGS